MEPDYKETSPRFREEREKRNLSQEDMCRILNMTQGHFSRAENGENYFSYEHLQKLNAAQFDMHFIFSGKRCDTGMLEYQSLRDGAAARDYYSLAQMCFALLQRVDDRKKYPGKKSLLEQNDVVRCVINFPEQNIWYWIRRYHKYSQAQMAEELNVDIKTYIGLEKEKKFPHSGTVFELYRRFHVPPQLVLGDKRGILYAICETLNRLDVEDKDNVLERLKQIYDQWFC